MSTSSVTSPLTVTAPQTTLTGASSYSSTLQAAVTRAISIASLPMQLLQADQNQATSQATELGQLNSLFSSVQTSLQSVVSGTSNGALAATSSDTSVAQASLSGSALPGTYTVNVLTAGSESSAISSAPQTPITDPTTQSISQATSFTLTVGTQTYTVQPSGQNLNALASAINSSGAPAQAVVVNLGSPTAADYRLVVQATNFGANTVQLNDGTNLLGVLATGSSASYTVDGQPPAGITTNSSTVTIAGGLEVTLGGQTGPTTVTVSASLSSVSNALSNFVTAFNSAITELQKNYGQNGGALTGDGSVLDMSQVLSQIGTYTGSTGGSITNLTQLGVEFTDQGTLTFDPTVIAGLSQSQINDALTFLGSPTTGGFLQYATNSLSGITDPTTGVIASESQALQNQVNTDQTQINNDQAQITELQATLQAQMAQSDALIATLQQQNTFLQGLFQYATSNNPDVASAA
jgi:flagellar hook-associated protein 2